MNSFSVSWKPASSESVKSGVNRQIEYPLNNLSSDSLNKNNPKISAKEVILGSTKADMIRSLSISGMILAFEVVLYFALRSY